MADAPKNPTMDTQVKPPGYEPPRSSEGLSAGAQRKLPTDGVPSPNAWQPSVQDGEVYRFLTTFYLDQDRLSWSRIQTLVAVEGGVLTGAYSTRGLFGVVTLVLGAGLVFLILQLIERDWECRDHHLQFLDRVHQPRGIRVVIPARYPWRRGSCIVRFISWGLIVVDLVGAVFMVVL